MCLVPGLLRVDLAWAAGNAAPAGEAHSGQDVIHCKGPGIADAFVAIVSEIFSSLLTEPPAMYL